MSQNVDPHMLFLIEQSEGESWLFIKNLREGDVLEVRTRNTLYTMRVIDPEGGTVLVNSDGQHITEEAPGRVLGSSLTGTGTMVKMGGIANDSNICLFVEGIGELLLSATEWVKVNGVKVLPVEVADWRDEIESMGGIDELQQS